MKLTNDWLNNILTKQPKDAWEEIFSRLCELVPDSEKDIKTSYRKIEADIAHIDHVLASSAWDLWENFSLAPRASQYVHEFWDKTIGPKAVLILDSLSIREINPIISTIKDAGLTVKKFNLAGSEIPSETDIYANAMGISGRASLSKEKIPSGLIINTDNTYVDSFKKIPLDETVGKIPNEVNIFLWHGWPDDSLHDFAKVDDAFKRFVDHVDEIIKSEGFIGLIKKLAHNRELLITSDHGYCNTSNFSTASGDHHQELKLLGHTRAKKVSDINGTAGRTIPPATMEMQASVSSDVYRLAMGRLRPSDRGFPALTHGGLSIMECAVPLIHVTEGNVNG